MPNHERRIHTSDRGAAINAQDYIIGVDIGGTHIRVGVVSPGLDLLHEEKISTSLVAGANAKERLVEWLSDYINRINLKIKTVSVGFPSNINKNRDLVIITPNVDGLENLPKSFLEENLNLPVMIEKDTCMLLHYDMHHHHISKGMLIGYYIGTGFGNIMMLDGKIITGKDGVAGELGHIPVLFKDDVCPCGQKGCAELYAAGKGLEHIRLSHFPTTHISEVFAKHGNTPEVKGFIENVAKIIVVEIHILNPDTIILGGGVLNMDRFPYDLLIEKIHQFTRKPVPESTLEIFRSEANDPFSGVIGAALFANNGLSERISNDSIG
ncbi:MAG: allose kinase [Leptolinea sp.]|nr:allose kinase [Leptolinea sp.]